MSVDMATMVLKDRTYFFRDYVENERLVRGQLRARPLTPEAYYDGLRPLHEVERNSSLNILLGGEPIYDESSGTVRYQAKLTRSNNHLSHALTRYNLDPIPGLAQARTIEAQIVDELINSRLSLGFTTALVPLGEDMYVVAVRVTSDDSDNKHPNNAQTVHDGLVRLVSRINI